MAKQSGTTHRTAAQRLAAAEAQAARLREQVRREETRRKVLIGAMILGRAETDDEVMERLTQELDGWLTNNRDRRLFADYGIQPIPEQTKDEEPPKEEPQRGRYDNPIGT